ncbi:LysR family transcriptional regulator, transcriptional activator of nhaA [Prosthecobacter debontii]|uniref:LysR family transcriptional regulator, transcriptional activator of nhaA n=1 Tax=Prosthecobacter debontii TaxID=48467 RepID=A0A1T4WFD3_9BACT|nr:LysR family transcriptional regulator [Prosthecobacter debontii]SKA76013.1 LysR family transcriptional regulator, transcriptional activator of nhaA [Prosthecobacter debontii]
MNPADLNYHHLRLFWEVARAGSLRAAATKLHLSQPTISTQIKALEQTFAQSLFDRTGRRLKLTAAGRLVMERSDEIFSLGAELLQSLQSHSEARTLRLNIGITDSLPKLVAWRLMNPMVQAFPNLQLSCSEGHSQELLGDLASGRLDVILSDEAASSSHAVRAYSRLLGHPQVHFCAVPALAKKFHRHFPSSLHEAPMLLPSGRTAWRHELDRWFEATQLHPHLVAEFDDAALMKTAAADGLGITPVTATLLQEAAERYGLQAIGQPVDCGFPCYLITLDRNLAHPALPIMTTEAKKLFK